MTDQQTQWQHCHEEANRLRRELKALNANRATLTDPAEIEEKKKEAHLLQTQYNTVLEKLKEMKDEYEWEKSVNREFDCIEQPD
jgi:chromosome segregation ATPase